MTIPYILLGAIFIAQMGLYYFLLLRRKPMQVGDDVLYTMEFDADTSYSPNIGPAKITKIINETTLDLYVFFQNGSFVKLNCVQGQPGFRGTWHPKG